MCEMMNDRLQTGFIKKEELAEPEMDKRFLQMKDIILTDQQEVTKLMKSWM